VPLLAAASLTAGRRRAQDNDIATEIATVSDTHAVEWGRERRVNVFGWSNCGLPSLQNAHGKEQNTTSVRRPNGKRLQLHVPPPKLPDQSLCSCTTLGFRPQTPVIDLEQAAARGCLCHRYQCSYRLEIRQGNCREQTSLQVRNSQ